MDNGDFECKCGTVLEHVPDDYADLYCPACEPEKEGIKENGNTDILASYKGFDATACPVSVLGWSQCRKVAELLGLPRYRGSGTGIPEYRLMVKRAQRGFVL